jgi:ABC-2 type transport system ATP-binding protein
MNPRGQSSIQTVVEAEGLVKTFSDFWLRARARAVDGVTFEIRPHEIFGLLGPNGSGKSTTIKLILGLLRKSKGRLSVFGRDPSDVAVKARIGYLPEETYMYRFLNPRETLDYFGKLFGLPRSTRRRRTDELLEMVGLEGAAHRVVGEFSKGMARRLGIAQALINDPEFLILDEPTSGLDPIGTRQVKDLLLDLRRKGKTVLLSSHLLADVEDVCDRMVILYGGKIRASGTAEELLRDTKHTTIHLQRLDAEAISKVDAVLRREVGVAVDRVESPRQRLEDLFLQIVDAARAEQLETSGAMRGGPTAAFLGEGDASQPSAVIADLERTAAESKRATTIAATAPSQSEPQLDAIAELQQSGEALPRKPASVAATKAEPVSVDKSVIDGLLGGTDDLKRDGEGGGYGARSK